MAGTGPLGHVDISVGYPDRSIAFYDVFLTALGFRRGEGHAAEFRGDRPTRAIWTVPTGDGHSFAIEVRPARPDARDQRYDRYRPGPHHLAFRAESAAKVDEVYAAMVAAGATVLDAPQDYSGRDGYCEGYYAAYYEDPDGVKLEVVHEPRATHAPP